MATATATFPVQAEAKPKGDNLKWWVLVTVIIGTFLG
jgi:hypothetical protein